MAQTKMMSFADIIQGENASVRVTDDSLLYAVDLTMKMTGADMNYASQVKPLKSALQK